MLFKLLSDSQTYMQIHTPNVVQGGGGGWNPSPVFLQHIMLQYFETILPLVESF